MSLPVLNLPPITPRIQTNVSGRQMIFDEQRKKFVTLTAEEWVRQHFVSFLLNQQGVPAALLQNEVGVDVNGVSRRCDTVIFSPETGEPLVIVEYKAPSVSITQEVFLQIQSYNSILRAQYLIVSNGMRHFCCHMDYDANQITFLPEIPKWSELNPK